MNENDNKAVMKETLVNLRKEHRELDESITSIEQSATPDTLKIQRLKKRKLVIRDQIVNLENQLLPDNIA